MDHWPPRIWKGVKNREKEHLNSCDENVAGLCRGSECAWFQEPSGPAGAASRLSCRSEEGFESLKKQKSLKTLRFGRVCDVLKFAYGK